MREHASHSELFDNNTLKEFDEKSRKVAFLIISTKQAKSQTITTCTEFMPVNDPNKQMGLERWCKQNIFCTKRMNFILLQQ
jgi:hypothetical protein